MADKLVYPPLWGAFPFPQLFVFFLHPHYSPQPRPLPPMISFELLNFKDKMNLVPAHSDLGLEDVFVELVKVDS